MRFRDYTVAALGLLVLTACTAAQVTTAENDVAAANNLITADCAAANKALGTASAVAKGGAANTVASYGAYVTGACASATVIGQIATDPSTDAWLQGIVSSLNTIAGVPAAAAAAPAP